MDEGTGAPGLDDPGRAIVEDPGSGGETLVVAFGGIAHNLDGIPPFEFLKVLADLPVHRVFVRDPLQSWYQAGIPGGGGTAEDFTDALREIKERRRPARIVTIGVSAGGFAAIRFGCDLDADVALAFSPQTFTGNLARRLHRETRWREQTANIDRVPSEHACRDLRPVVRDARRRGAPTQIVIHVGRHRGDRRHVRRLRRFDNVTVVDHDGGHNVAQALRDQGRLDAVLTEAIRGPGRPGRASAPADRSGPDPGP